MHDDTAIYDGSPADLFALATKRADEYLTVMDLERDFESRFLTTRYLFETVVAFRDIARGGLTDPSRGVAYDDDRIELAALLLPTLESDWYPRVQSVTTSLDEGFTLLVNGLHVSILNDYFRD